VFPSHDAVVAAVPDYDRYPHLDELAGRPRGQRGRGALQGQARRQGQGRELRL